MYGAGPSRDLAAERRARRTEAQRKRRLEQRESTDPEVIAKRQAWAERARQYIRVRRAQETPEEHAARLATRRASRPAQYRAQVNAESAEQREQRLKAARISNRESRKRRAQQNAQHHEFATNIFKRKLNSDSRNKRTYAHPKYEFTSWNESRFLHCNADPAAPRTARCVVPVCHSRSAPSSILYPLPAEPSQRQAWIDFVRGCPCGDACDWNPPTNEISFVCSLHFTVRCFRFQQPRGGSAGYRKRLKRGAVPTLYPIEEQCSSTANKNAPDGTAERLVHLDHLNMSHLHVSALLSEIRPRSFFTAQLLGASSRIQHWLPLPSKMQKGGHAIHWLPASQLQHKIKDTVLVTRMQCGSWHVLQRSNSSFPETSPPSVA
ncbi:uncharacterized protein [Dermacentor albipictus]|uniref:uncharacterized protein isoform X2 n=1 Tax=Dermacentor albipictus TaxID=60249 RepID=UPI0038FC78AD